MIYEEEDRVVIYTRDTAGWASLPWQARGIALELTRKLDKRGELSLGRRGLAALGKLLGANWEEIAPFVQELLDDGRFVHDVERGIVRDPQHAARQEAARLQAAGFPSHAFVRAEARPSSTKRVQAHRERRRDSQLEIPQTHERDLRAPPFESQVMRCVRPQPPPDDGPVTDETLGTFHPLQPVSSTEPANESAVTTDSCVPQMERFIKRSRKSPSLSDLKISEQKSERGGASRDVVQRDAPLPDDCRASFVEACKAVGLDIGAEFVWRKFAAHAHRKRWKMYEVADRWTSWGEREIAWTKQLRGEQRPDRPGIATARATSDREHTAMVRQWELEATSPEARAQAIAAAAALARGDFLDLRHARTASA